MMLNSFAFIACSKLWGFITVRVSAAVFLLIFMAVSYGHAADQPTACELDRGFVRASVEAIAQVVEREYLDPAVAAKVATDLRKRLAEGGYHGVKTLESLAEAVTRDMFETTHDKHLVVTVVKDRSLTTPAKDSDDARTLDARRINFGIQRVEILAGNVGYLNLTAFFRPDEAADAISTAMKMLRSADALIIDMRENGGGSPDTVAIVASYLFDAPALPLFDIVPRSGNAGRQYKTLEADLPDRNGTRPVYVLTAAQTFSAGEGLAFLLQERRRAEIVGEQTAGAANPGRPYSVNAELEVTVPNGQIRTAISGKNWEGKGVTPDVTVQANDALRTAHMRALRELLGKNPGGLWQENLKQQVHRLETSGKSVY